MTNQKFLLIMMILLTGVALLNSFQPQPFHFSNEYQYKLYLSWLHRGGFADEGPAKLSQHNFTITFRNRVSGEEAVAELDLEVGKVVVQIERIESIAADEPSAERSYRYYLEQLLYRLNTEHDFFVTDFINHYGITLQSGAKTDISEIVSSLLNYNQGQRLRITSARFAQHSGTGFRYELVLNVNIPLNVTFDKSVDLSRLVRSLRGKESASSDIREISFSQGRVFVPYRETPPRETPSPPRPAAVQQPHLASLYAPPPRHPSRLTPPPAAEIRKLTMSDFIKSYRDYHWSREILHNKIPNRDRFLRQEFPAHSYTKDRAGINLDIGLFQENLSGSLRILERELRDGISFISSGEYEIEDEHVVRLATGETVSLANLDDKEIVIIAPYMNQLVTMHRVIGTKLLNFLLVPADVPTTLVIRDPERDFMEFESYTDLILMLSHYWDDRNIYFNIDNVKKVNNYVEISAHLVADNSRATHFDFAEIRFALDKSYRIDLAMVILHTNVEKEK